MGATKAAAGIMLDDLFSVTRYLALFVGDPVDSSGDRQAATELTGGSYARLEVTAAEVTVDDNVATISAQAWFTASAAVTGDPGFLVLCSASAADVQSGIDQTVLWSQALSPDLSTIANNTVVSVQGDAITFTANV